MDKILFSFGHGYCAQALTRQLVPLGWRVIGTTRSSDRFDAIRASGAEPCLFPGHGLPPGLDVASHVLISASPDAGGDPVLGQLKDSIAHLARTWSWVGYLSTTGVYGDHAGGWVDETTPLTPGTARGQWRAKAESQWQAVPDLALHIFRLAGIYGPGRGPFAKVRSGTAQRIIKPGQVFSRIHVEDIVQVLLASIRRPSPGAIYNVCDDDPAPPEDVIAHAATLLGLPLPPAIPFDAAAMSPMARSFYAESKKVSNRRIREDLGIDLIHPDYRSGLAALLADND